MEAREIKMTPHKRGKRKKIGLEDNPHPKRQKPPGAPEEGKENIEIPTQSIGPNSGCIGKPIEIDSTSGGGANKTTWSESMHI
jgi:hypothetical protein